MFFHLLAAGWRSGRCSLVGCWLAAGRRLNPSPLSPLLAPLLFPCSPPAPVCCPLSSLPPALPPAVPLPRCLSPLPLLLAGWLLACPVGTAGNIGGGAYHGGDYSTPPPPSPAPRGGWLQRAGVRGEWGWEGICGSGGSL